jgi:hypothetical protein
MDIQEAVKNLRALANEIDPDSGQTLAADSIYLRPPAIKALNRALSAGQHEQCKGIGPATPIAPGHERKILRFANNYVRAWIIKKLPKHTIGGFLPLWRAWLKLGKISAPSSPQGCRELSEL